jgi:hypothetical protein
MRSIRTKTCIKCKATFLALPGDGRECPKCRGAVTISIELSADELRRLEALATIRGVTVAELARAVLSEYAT